MIYFLLILSGLLIALSFCVNKYFQEYKPAGETSSVLYTLLGKVAATAFFLVLALATGAPLWGNGYTLLVGLAHAVLNLFIMIFGIRVLAVGSVAAYTVSMMIGGMAIPVLFGVFLFRDPFGPMRVAAFCLIAVAVALSMRGEGKKLRLRALLFYAIIFACNGFIGVFTALHSNLWGAGVSDITFMFTASWVASLFSLPVLGGFFFAERKKAPLPRRPFPSRLKKTLYYLTPALAGILLGVANYLIVIGTAADDIGSVATFPITTGGSILFTVLLSAIFYREKLGLQKLLSALLILAGLTLFIL